MSDECIMVNRIGHVFLGGPPLVKAATGEGIYQSLHSILKYHHANQYAILVVTHEELGGATKHTSVSGVADYFAGTEEESFAQVRDIISSKCKTKISGIAHFGYYLQYNVFAGLNLELPREFNHLEDPPEYDSSELDRYAGLDVISKDDMKAVIARIVDGSRFSEFKAPFGQNLITGFAKICDQLVGICANAGPISKADGQKGAHFLQLCDSRNTPVIFLQNNSGNSSGEELNYDALKESAKFAHSSANCHVPKISVNVGGLGGPQDLVSMCGPSFGSRFHLSWPRARYSKNPLEPISEEASASDFHEESAQYAASRCTIDGVILPRETRNALAKCLQISLLNHEPMGRILQQKSVLRI